MPPAEGETGSGARGDAGPRGRGGRARGNRGNGAKRGGRGRGQSQGSKGQNELSTNPNSTSPANNQAGQAATKGPSQSGEAPPSGGKQVVANSTAGQDGGEDDDGEVCFICANPVAHLSIAPCNHTTCHICGLRMRALYKTKDCAHCRTSAPFVIFTNDPEKKFEQYKDSDFTSTDSNIGIKYANEDIVGDTVLLLRYNCPDPSCDFAGMGWADLHRHVKSAHKKRMCDLCTRNKKVFTHEHELFTDKELEKHMRRGDDKPGAADQTGFKGHPLCNFCGERFYDDDKLYEHCRMKHERCFICDRRDSRHPHYYLNYDELEKHFKKDHFLCSDRGCLEKKFVVFESELDMQAHQLAEHAGKSVGRDARLVDISAFDIRQSYQEERRGNPSSQRDGARGGRGRGNRGRDPNAEDILPTTLTPGPLRRDEIAFQRQLAISSAGSSRTFQGQLSAPTPSSAATTPPASASAPGRNAAAGSRARTAGSSPTVPPGGNHDLSNPMEALSLASTANLSAGDHARLVRHGSVIERAANLLGNDSHKMATFRSHISSFRQNSLTAPQLIEAFFTLFANVSSNALGTLVRELADLFDDKGKADTLRKAWQDWRAINDDYPSLPGLGGMHGASTNSGGWASAAALNPGMPAQSQNHSSRVIKLKNSTRLGGPSPNTARTPPGWVPATSSSNSTRPPPSSAFPSLPPSAPSGGSSSRAAASPQPSWLGSAGQSSQSRTQQAPPSTRGEDAFPALPAAPKPTTTIFGYGVGRGVRRDWGQAESNFQWGSSSSAPSSSAGGAGQAAPQAQPDEAEEGGGSGRGKKGGKKGKKVLVQWG